MFPRRLWVPFYSLLLFSACVSGFQVPHRIPARHASSRTRQTRTVARNERNVSNQEPLPTNHELDDNHRLSRRLFIASALIGTGAALSPDAAVARTETGNLSWERTPVNKRTGVTVYDAEDAGFNVLFVTYLARFLLQFDADCQRWWISKASDIPRTAPAEQVNSIRFAQFGAFAASVEVGLQEFRDQGRDNKGSRRLLEALLKRYCPDLETLKAQREENNLSPLTEKALARQQREIKEARRQIAILFSLMEKNQPVEEITKLLAAIDNGSISSVRIVNPGSGYAPGYGPPRVQFPQPQAGPEFDAATGRAVLTPNGKILRIDIVNRGFGYSKSPTVTISPPAAMSFDTSAEPATATASIFRSGVNKGRLEKILVKNPGSGYVKNETIRVQISPPELPSRDGGVPATATAVLELEVSRIDVISGGSGYAVEKPISVYVEPPPLTARVNMNDPMMARIIPPEEPLPPTTLPSKQMLRNMPNATDPNSVSSKVTVAATNDGRGGGGGCIGRACYDGLVEAVAIPRANKTSYTQFREEDDVLKLQTEESALGGGSRTGSVSGTDSGADRPALPFWGGGPSSSSQLLSLLPSGIGLEYDTDLKRYRLAVGDDYLRENPAFIRPGSSNRPLDPEFGPRGRSPIEREKQLDLSTFLRFSISGAMCCSGVHVAVTPIDVVKTKVQTDPVKYDGVISSFGRVVEEEGGFKGLFNGWQPTFLGWFLWGGVTYALTELLRRYFTELAGPEAANLDVPIILFAAAFGAFVGCFVITPFEAVRIRSVAQPNYAPSIVQVAQRMIKEEGLGSLFNAVPVVMAKEIPFAMTKFTIFDLSTAYLYTTFPVAREDLQLSLLVSLIGGTIGGAAAAVTSNPADATISVMKKAKTEMGPAGAVQLLLDDGGPLSLFRGLQLRLVFYSLVVSLQFLVYDSVRFALGIGADDLKLYLDVLGGALRNSSGGPL